MSKSYGFVLLHIALHFKNQSTNNFESEFCVYYRTMSQPYNGNVNVYHYSISSA